MSQKKQKPQRKTTRYMVETVAILPNNVIIDSDNLRRKMLRDELKTLQAVERITKQRIATIQRDLASIETAAAERDCKLLIDTKVEQAA